MLQILLTMLSKIGTLIVDLIDRRFCIKKKFIVILFKNENYFTKHRRRQIWKKTFFI